MDKIQGFITWGLLGTPLSMLRYKFQMLFFRLLKANFRSYIFVSEVFFEKWLAI